MAGGGNFYRKYFFISLQFFHIRMTQDDSIDVTIDTFV